MRPINRLDARDYRLPAVETYTPQLTRIELGTLAAIAVMLCAAFFALGATWGSASVTHTVYSECINALGSTIHP